MRTEQEIRAEIEKEWQRFVQAQLRDGRTTSGRQWLRHAGRLEALRWMLEEFSIEE